MSLSEEQCTCDCDVCLAGSHCHILDTGCNVPFPIEDDLSEDDISFLFEDGLPEDTVE